MHSPPAVSPLESGEHDFSGGKRPLALHPSLLTSLWWILSILQQEFHTSTANTGLEPCLGENRLVGIWNKLEAEDGAMGDLSPLDRAPPLLCWKSPYGSPFSMGM